MKTDLLAKALFTVLFALSQASALIAEERTERFDKDPNWDGHNNRATSKPRPITQDFGYSKTNHAKRGEGEIGGFLSAAAEPAFYAKKLSAKTFDDTLTASGTLACDGQPTHVLLGFFNADTLNEWRTPNTVALRISGRGDVIYAWLEYCTGRWRAGGDDPVSFPTVEDPKTGRKQFKGFAAKGAVHQWSLTYDPKGNNGKGVVTATIDDEKAVCHLADGHRADGAKFNRFGLLNVMKHADGGGEIWLDDVTVNGAKEDFAKDPNWDQFRNRRQYETTDIRPRFDFGYSSTQHAGGKGQGELGGLVYRGDCRYENTLAYYGDRLEELSMDKSLRASGRVSLKRGVTDSTTLIGFFHSKESVQVNPSQNSGIPKSFLGAAIEGPSRDGFLFYPMYRVNGDGSGYATGDRPKLFPDGSAHEWSLDYFPAAADGRGRISVTLDGKTVSLDLIAGHKVTGARFDRFGLVTTWIDGNGQHVYFDDLTYTCKQEEEPQAQILKGHQSSVMCVAFSPDGTLLASSSRDKTIRLWDARTGQERRVLQEHTADVYSVTFSPDGATLVSGGGDNTIRLWDAATGKVKRTITGAGDVVRWVVFSPDGKALASGSVDGKVRLWDVATGKVKVVLAGHEGRAKSVAFSPDGKVLVSGGDDKIVRLWDVETGKERAALQGHTGPLESVAFAPDGQTVASSSNDGTVRLWNVRTGELRHTLEGHEGEVDAVVYSLDGKTLASGCKDKTIKLWDPATGKLLRTLRGHEDRVESLAFSPTGQVLASGSGGKDATVRLWEVGGKKE